MHSEHLTNVRPPSVLLGWLLSVGVASALLLAMEGTGLLGDSDALDAVGIAVAVAIGFGVGGYVTGFRTAAAPLLHGAAMAGTSFVVWFLLNLAIGGFTTGISEWEPITMQSAALGLLIQGGAALTGCWLGYRAAPARVE